jgi:hypothetical protein
MVLRSSGGGQDSSDAFVNPGNSMIARALLNRLRASDHAAPEGARAAAAADRVGPASIAVEPGQVIDAAVGWLARAQDRSATADGGVARHYSLISGWGPSYPETTGYIIPTFLAYAEQRHRPDIAERARRMLDWLVAIQLPGSGFQGGVIGSSPVVPVVFNTGQILMGLVAGERLFGGYRKALREAADWLVAVQDTDGCWRRHASPFAPSGEKAYDAHVAWGLLDAARVTGETRYGEAALQNLRWVLTRQHRNGWFADCCLSDTSEPLTHTLGYALRGIIEGYRFSADPVLLGAAQRAADGIMSALGPDGKLPGRLDAGWRGTVDWACLTGSSQIACCWLLLHHETRSSAYLDAAVRTNGWVRRTVALDGSPDVIGGVRGSFPIDGGYGRYEFLNWAAKFTIDANMLESELSPVPCPEADVRT